MKRFLITFFVFVAPILVLGISIELLIRNIPNDYLQKRFYLDKNSNKVDVLFLGDSHSYYGLNPVFLPLNSFNASYISQTLDYDFEILKKYDGNWSHLKYIVVSISYPSLFYQLKSSAESWRVKNYCIYYDIASSNNLTDYFELLSNNSKTNLERINSYYLLGETNITSSKLGWGTSYNSKNQRDLTESGASAAKRHTWPTDTYFDENVNVLKSLIRFANDRQIKVIFYTPPAFHTYVEHLDTNQLNRTVSEMTKLESDYQNIIYVNFLSDNSFTAADFFDADHLNEIGAEKLTLKISDLINALQ